MQRVERYISLGSQDEVVADERTTMVVDKDGRQADIKHSLTSRVVYPSAVLASAEVGVFVRRIHQASRRRKRESFPASCRSAAL
jgi:hypothetical protein